MNDAHGAVGAAAEAALAFRRTGCADRAGGFDAGISAAKEEDMMRLFTRVPAEAPSAKAVSVLSWRAIPRRYRAPELAFVIVSGLVIFVLTGYLGYQKQPNLVRQLFGPPALLYLWLCLILFLILLRHPAVKGQVRAPAITFLVSMCMVGVYYIDRQYLNSWVANHLSQLLHDIVPALTGGRFLANLVNFGVLLWYAVTVTLSWARRLSGDPKANGSASPGTSVTSLTAFTTWRDVRSALRGELFSGDLLAGAVIAGFFGWLFSPPIFGLLRTLASAPAATKPDCTITLPVYPCPPPSLAHVPPYISLTFVDMRIAFIFAGIGGLWLISSSAIKAFRSVAMERLIVEIVRSLLSALGRLLTLRFLNLIKALWLPALLFAPVAAVLAAQMMWCDEHFLGGDVFTTTSCQLTQLKAFNPLAAAVAFLLLIAVLGAVSLLPKQVGGPALNVLDQLSGVLVFVLVLVITLDFAVTNGFGTVTLLGHPINLGINQDDQYVLRAVAWLLIAALALIWGLGLWLERWDVITQTLIFLAFLGWLVAAIFWVFAMILTGADRLFAPSSWPHPFYATDAVWFSFAAFVVTALAYIVARIRPRGGAAAPGSQPGAGTPGGSELETNDTP
jgi:hypothetical protein